MSLPEDDIDWSLLDRYLSGSCTPEESDVLHQWAASDLARAHLLASVKRIWDVAGEAPQRFDAERAVRALELVRANEDRQDGAADAPGRTPRAPQRPMLALLDRPARRWRWMRLAAAAVLIIAAASVVWHWRARGWSTEANALTASARKYATAPGQRAVVLLTDGTRVWLNVDSKLRIPADFGAKSRRVELEGEAYFEVMHDGRRPFSVRTAHAVVEDVGTEFLVRGYIGDSSISVIVAEGEVALRSSLPRTGRVVPLVPGQRAEIDSVGRVAVSDDPDIDEALSWRDGRLTLHHVPLSYAVRELERWYGVDIALADTSLASVIVTASFGSDSIDDALQNLSRMLGVRYTRRGTHVRLLPGHTF